MNEWMWLAGVLGACVGSFANVMIHRLPRMLMEPPSGSQERFDLSWPGSHCPQCQTPLRWWHNVPLVSYVLLRGRCAFCGHGIAARYPVVEGLSSLLWVACVWHWGAGPGALCWALLGTGLLALTVIDWQTTLLPDALTQPLLWLGLLASTWGWTDTTPNWALWGAAWGYCVLWAVATVFERLTGKEGMGRGDFKLLSALGAWLGPLNLVPLILLASLSGLVVGLFLHWRKQLREGGYLPFGPFLAVAGMVVAWLGPNAYLLITLPG